MKQRKKRRDSSQRRFGRARDEEEQDEKEGNERGIHSQIGLSDRCRKIQAIMGKEDKLQREN